MLMRNHVTWFWMVYKRCRRRQQERREKGGEKREGREERKKERREKGERREGDVIQLFIQSVRAR